jgi:hypothetical protein
MQYVASLFYLSPAVDKLECANFVCTSFGFQNLPTKKLVCKKGWTKLAMSTVIGFRMKFHGSFGGNLAAGLQQCKFTFLAETRLII